MEEEAGDVEEGFGFLNDRDGQDEFLRQFQEVQITLQKIKWLNIFFETFTFRQFLKFNK